MPKARFLVTYDIVTYESAEHGDVAESGFVTPGGWRDADPCLDPPEAHAMTLREALDLVSPVYASSSHPRPGDWFIGHETQDYRTGESETRSLHPPRDITPSSMRRLARVLGTR